MKVSFVSLFALSTCFLGVLSAPTAEANTDDVEKRQINSAYSIVDSLFSDIKQYTGAINATAAGLSSSSTQADNATAAAAYRSNVKHMTKLINDATKKVNALSESKPSDLEVRQATSPTALATLVTNLLLEVGGALNQIIGTLGLTSLLGFLNPLVASLSNLLLSLRTVVDQLLALVQQLLDGLLVGLSNALAGLNL